MSSRNYRPAVLAVALLTFPSAWAQVPAYSGPGLRPNPRVERAFREVTELTTGLREDDHPSVSSNGDMAWMTWVSYSETDRNSLVFARSLKKGETRATG